MRPAPRRARHREPGAPPVHRERLGRAGGVDPAQGRLGGAAAGGDPRRARSRGCSSSASTRWSRCRTRTSSARRWRSSSTSPSSTSSSPRPRATPTWSCPGSLMEEDEGTTTNVEGRVIHHQKAVEPPRGRARGLADHLRSRGAARRGRQVRVPARRARSSRSCASPRRAASPTTSASPGSGSTASWACSGRARRSITRARRGSTRAGASATPTARRTSSRSSGGPPPKSPTPTTRSSSPPAAWSRTTSPARRRGGSAALVDADPEPCCEIHPRLAGKLGIADGDFVEVESRRGSVVVRGAGRAAPSAPTPSSFPTTGRSSAPRTAAPSARIDPVSKIPEFKICAVRVRKVDRPGRPIARLAPAGRGRPVSELAFFIDYSRCIGCRACVQACEECDTHRGRLDDPPRDRSAAATACRPRRRSACTARIRSAPGSARPTRSSRRPTASTQSVAQAALHRLLELRARLPLRRAEVLRSASIR